MSTERFNVTIGYNGLISVDVPTTPENRDRLLAAVKARIAATHQQLESGEFRWDASVVPAKRV